MNVKELYNFLDKKIPRELSAEWDNDGLMCAPAPEKEVKKVIKELNEPLGAPGFPWGKIYKAYLFENIRFCTRKIFCTFFAFSGKRWTKTRNGGILFTACAERERPDERTTHCGTFASVAGPGLAGFYRRLRAGGRASGQL